MNVVTREQIGERGDGHRAAARASLTRRGTQVSRDLDHGLTLSAGGDNLGQLRRAEDSPLFTGAKPPPTWRIALRGPW